MIYEIINKGFHASTTEQLVKRFRSTGQNPIYFRPTEWPEIMLTSADPITDEDYDKWADKRKKKYND